jgi:hypothetical protein
MSLGRPPRTLLAGGQLVGSTKSHRWATLPKRSVVVFALALDAFSVTLFAALLTVFTIRGPGDSPPETFASDPLPAVLLGSAASIAILAGAVAIGSLVRDPLTTNAGRWATRLAVVSALLVPVVGVVVSAGAWLAGLDLPEGWGQPLVPIWFVTSVTACVLGFLAREPRRRGVLVLPFLVGAFVLVFWIGELAVPH